MLGKLIIPIAYEILKILQFKSHDFNCLKETQKLPSSWKLYETCENYTRRKKSNVRFVCMVVYKN